MKVQLFPHPDTPGGAIRIVTAEIARTDEGELVIRYEARGDVDRLRVPGPVRYSSRHDGLWTTTCFEAFVRRGGERAYLELNFAPSTGWAAYRFASYREGRADQPLPAPHFDVDRLGDCLAVTVAIDPAGMDWLPVGETWCANLTAVIEELDGTKSYWALAHPDGAPDFHDPACFVLELPAPSGA